jgi:hypothetical protein
MNGYCEVASVRSLRRSSTARRPHAAPRTARRLAIPTRAAPREGCRCPASGRKWIARLGERVLCVSASPFVKSARLLVAEGLPAAIVIEMWRPNTDESALQGRLGAVAATVIDGETTSRCAKKGAPASDSEKSALHRELLVYVRPRAVLGARRVSAGDLPVGRNSGQWRRRSLTARRLRAAPKRVLRRAIPRKVSRDLLVYVRPRAVLGARRVSAGDLPVGRKPDKIAGHAAFTVVDQLSMARSVNECRRTQNFTHL